MNVKQVMPISKNIIMLSNAFINFFSCINFKGIELRLLKYLYQKYSNVIIREIPQSSGIFVMKYCNNNFSMNNKF